MEITAVCRDRLMFQLDLPEQQFSLYFVQVYIKFGTRSKITEDKTHKFYVDHTLY